MQKIWFFSKKIYNRYVLHIYYYTMTIMKEKNVGIYLKTPESLKEEFDNLAIALWTNSTNLLKMLMKRAIHSESIDFPRPKVLDLDFEPLDTSNWSSTSIKKAEKITKRLEKIL